MANLPLRQTKHAYHFIGKQNWQTKHDVRWLRHDRDVKRLEEKARQCRLSTG